MALVKLLKSSQLEIGQIVYTYGMRVLLESAHEPRISNGSMTYAYVGKVINLDEVLSGGFVPPAFMQRTEWIEGRGWTVVQDDYWIIQGNDLAQWAVENHEFKAGYLKGNTGSALYCGACDKTRDAGLHF